ncbi:hypothetical protein [Rhizobium leguminosarum]|uniref:phage tail tube protein n=1 Tax=Rhizobium leguminosarum TaxID=384 RepID=UPI00144279B4|nr:hypothetical protein [Rhizobium leguminosarum]NKJ77759.1 hypothetical protein [Rhizobium leguminosarum bv. viciae]
MAMTINTIQDGYVFGSGVLFIKFKGNAYFEEMGDIDGLTVNVEVERDTRKDKRFGTSRTADSQVTDTTVTMGFTLMQHTNRNRALGVMGNVATMVQAQGTALTKSLGLVKANMHYEVGKFDISDVIVEGPSGTELLLGTDYTYDAKTGIIQPLSDFTAFDVTFDCAEILQTEERLLTGIAADTEIEGEALFIGTNNSGAKAHLRLWKVRFTPSSERSYISDDRVSFEIEGECLADAVKGLAAGDAEKYAYGIEQTLS